MVVPHQKHREWFFKDFSLPTIEYNDPAEIIIIDGEGTAPVKRNKGAKLAKYPFIFFCDDDICLAKNCLSKMYDAIHNIDYGFSYCNFMRAVFNGVRPNKPFLYSQPFNRKTLLHGNYISTMSLLKSEFLCEFDESLHRYQDWDFWLKVSERTTGIFIPEFLFVAYYLDNGISKEDLDIETINKIKKMYG